MLLRPAYKGITNALFQVKELRSRNPKTSKWEPAVIKDKMESVPRSYIVSTASGSELRRNRSQIRESFPKKSVRFDLEEDSPWVIEEDGTTSNQMNSPAADEMPD